MKVTIVISAFGTVTKGLLKGLEDLEFGGRVETIQTTVLQQYYRRRPEYWEEYWEESWRLEKTLLSLNLQWKM